MRRVSAEIFWSQLQYLDGDDSCLVGLMPILNELVVDLIKSPRSQYGLALLPLFRKCLVSINAQGLSIETIERDSLLDVLYRLGELVEIPRDSFYLEAWRGDW